MSENKKLSAFLQKNKKTKKTTVAETPKEETKKEVVQNAPVQEKAVKNTPKDSSSDEEEDELDIASKQLAYGTIKENKDVSGKQGEDKSKLGFGFEEQALTKEEVPKDKGPKRGFDGNMTFTRPTFKRKAPGKFGGEDFKEGLDDIDDEGNVKKQDNKRTRADMGGQLGSSARPRDEEAKEEKRVPGVKPTFKGRMNLTKTGANKEEASEGVSKTYDFGVVFKTAHGEEGKDGERKREPRKEGEGFGENKYGTRKPRERGQAFGQEQKEDNEEGFEVVKDKQRKPKKRFNDDSSSDENPEGARTGGFQRGPKRTEGDAVRRQEGGDAIRRSEGEAIRGGARVQSGGNRGGRGDRGGFNRN